MKKYNDKQVNEFLIESNAIEGVYSKYPALKDSWEAWNFAYKNRKKIDINYILEIHKLLIKNLNPRIAGKFRDCDVYIGGRRCIFVSESLLREEVQKWLKLCDINKLKNKSDKEKWEEIEFWHVYIEHIHPHEDCNGRLYRLMMNLQRFMAGLPIKIIHEGEEQMKYYKIFQEDNIMQKIIEYKDLLENDSNVILRDELL